MRTPAENSYVDYNKHIDDVLESNIKEDTKSFLVSVLDMYKRDLEKKKVWYDESLKRYNKQLSAKRQRNGGL